MPVSRAAKAAGRGSKRAVGHAETTPDPPSKRARVFHGKGTESQPIELLESQQWPPASPAVQAIDPTVEQPQRRRSPRKALADAASQATEKRPFESQSRNGVANEAIVKSVASSKAATVASFDEDNREEGQFDERFADNFDGINWDRLKRFCKPPRTQNVINYIQTPQQYDKFNHFQRLANTELPTHEKKLILEPIKAVVTRWNSYYSCFKRAAELQHAVSNYANYHIQRTRNLDDIAKRRGNKLPNVPKWMRSDGLNSADWAVITEYIDALKPLKDATKQLESCGKSGRFGALYSVIPVFETLLHELELRVKQYESVNFEQPGAPEDHIPINLRAAWAKADDYYAKLDASPYPYAATILHPYYKRYCDRSWRKKPDWLAKNNAAFEQLWRQYRPTDAPKSSPAAQSSDLEDAIAAIADADDSDDDDEDMDEYKRWKKLELKWTREQLKDSCCPICYWIELAPKYPNLSRLAINVLTIPASSCECERLFSELGDLLELKRRKIGAQLLAALQCIRAWQRAGFERPANSIAEKLEALVTDDELGQQYGICDWELSQQ